MARSAYQTPTISSIGSLHDMTLQEKTIGGADGIIFVIPGVGSINIGPVSGITQN